MSYYEFFKKTYMLFTTMTSLISFTTLLSITVLYQSA